MERILRGIWQKKSRTAILFLILSVGSYIAHVLYLNYSHRQYVSRVHDKDYVSHNYYSSSLKSRSKTAEHFSVDQIPIYSKHLQDYMHQIESVKSQLLSKRKSESFPSISPIYTVIDGYHENYFAELQKIQHVETVFLAVNETTAQEMMPLKEYFDYGSSKLGCERMVQSRWAVYHHGYELYNKSCRSDLEKTLVPSAIDRKSLSVGLPFQLSSEHEAPTGHASSDLILTFIHIVKDGLVSLNGDVFTGDICIKTQRCNKEIKFPSNTTNTPIYDEVFTITEQGSIWYYHLTIEDLPRIAPYVLFLQNNPQIKIHVSLADYHLEMLSLLGFGTERIVWGDVRSRIIYLPAGATCGRPSAFTTSLLSFLMRKKIEEKIGKQKQDSIIIIQRSDSFRQFQNHDAIHQAVHDLANQYDLKVQIFSDKLLPSLRVGLEVFYRAKAVIGPHGSGMANTIFAQPGMVVIEGLCYMDTWYRLCWKGYIPWLCIRPSIRFSLTFRNVAAVLGLHYYGIVRKDDCLYTTPEDVVEPLRYYLKHLN